MAVDEMTILATGNSGVKTIKGEELRAIPFTGYDGLSMGVGLGYVEGKGMFWGLMAPRKVINSYRGMKIAELVEVFDNGTLAACWYAGDKNIHESDKGYVDEIEAKIGKQERQEILEMIPKDFDNILNKLKENDIEIAGWEIEKEVEEGRLEITSRVQEFLDKYHKEVEKSEKSEYGLLIQPGEARERIRKIPFAKDTGKWFLSAYEEQVDPNTLIAIRHRTFGLGEEYIIGKSRENKRIEMTILGGVRDPLISSPYPALKIGLEFDGNDIEFKPSGPKKPGLLSKIKLKKPKESITDKFPLFGKEYGASIYPHRKIKNPDILADFTDRRLENLAISIQKSIEEKRDKAKNKGDK